MPHKLPEDSRRTVDGRGPIRRSPREAGPRSLSQPLGPRFATQVCTQGFADVLPVAGARLIVDNRLPVFTLPPRRVGPLPTHRPGRLDATPPTPSGRRFASRSGFAA